ncbi:hypothetical protein D9M70_448520 [compost metagenome]
MLQGEQDMSTTVAWWWGETLGYGEFAAQRLNPRDRPDHCRTLNREDFQLQGFDEKGVADKWALHSVLLAKDFLNWTNII